MKRLFAMAAIAAFTSCGEADKPAGEVSENVPLAQSKNSEAFNTAFGTMLANYYHLKDAFVLSNDTLSVKSATLLIESADNLKMNELKADSSISEVAEGYVKSISSEAKALIKEPNIEAKRKSFQMISDNMYDLLRSVRYDKQTVYHQFCPMAFNDAGAYWLSSTSDIKNPYFGRKMLTCGEVKDSIDYSRE
jgi:Cu(I)/Ag(I) efflux system membrane fusion protein